MKNIPRPFVISDENYSFVSIKMCIADFLQKCYLPYKITKQENKVNTLITDSNFCKSISRRSNYCYRDASPDI